MGNALICLPHSAVAEAVASRSIATSLVPRHHDAVATPSMTLPARLLNGITGQVHVLQEGTTVAEVMMDNPHSFLTLFSPPPSPRRFASQETDYIASRHAPVHSMTSSSSSAAGQLIHPQESYSFTALPADQNLENGCMYLLLPMHKLNRRASPEELAFFSSLAELAMAANPLLPSQSFPQPSTSACRSSSTHITCDYCTSIPANYTDNPLSHSHTFIPASQPQDSLSTSNLLEYWALEEHFPPIHRSRSWKPSLKTISESPLRTLSCPRPLHSSGQLCRLLPRNALREQHRVHSLLDMS
ncbi:hypothetical protein KP509_36G012800 [Ceratopteris richardii]|uniref:Uncharacterized protein n=1 Tax=Ceratopteris richardii TaxID=49495 RepID=A0A8T2QAV5_CERRI|nr:hypothetical protein KP509_36G012800 [Ceratopteris richardii]